MVMPIFMSYDVDTTMNKSIILYTIVAALGGFLFGFDTAVISGAEQAIQALWKLNDLEQGLTVSIALIGTVIGAMLGGIPSDRLGRKSTLFWIAALYLISAIGSAIAGNWYVFMVFRFIGGVGVGASSVAAPMYISEISTANMRGRMVALFQFNIVFGVLIAYLSNYLLQGSGQYDWRWMLGVEAFPAFVFLVLVSFIPRSPRWLIVKKRDIDGARRVLEDLEVSNVDAEIASIVEAHHKHVGNKNKDRLFSKKYSFPIMLAVLFAVFNQMTGINAVIYYAPRILESAGLERSSALFSTAGIGLINFLLTIVAMNFIDRLGRRFLMIVGSTGLIVALCVIAFAFYTQMGGYVVAGALLVYIAFFAFSQGAVIWVFIAEIFPNEVRANGQALGSFTHWIMAATISFFVPAAEKLGFGHTFLFFAVMMVLQLFFVLRVMPETKGISLESMENLLMKKAQ
jgi:sugar porter (SP) family MFS transporter